MNTQTQTTARAASGTPHTAAGGDGLHIDGTVGGDGTIDGDAGYLSSGEGDAPFYVFDENKQENIAGPFMEKSAAEEARATIRAERATVDRKHSPDWSGSPCPFDPANFWIDDNTGERVDAKTGARSAALVAIEITGAGFDGGTDATDERIVWIIAPAGYSLAELIADTGATVSPDFLNSEDAAQDADFILPGHAGALRARLVSFTLEGIPARLEYLRGELRAERMSYDELHELQSLAAHINAGDVELLEPAGVPEFSDDETGGDEDSIERIERMRQEAKFSPPADDVGQSIHEADETAQAIARAAEAAMNAGARVIQDALGVKTGDTAAQFFDGTDGPGDMLREVFGAYLLFERERFELPTFPLAVFGEDFNPGANPCTSAQMPADLARFGYRLETGENEHGKPGRFWYSLCRGWPEPEVGDDWSRPAEAIAEARRHCVTELGRGVDAFTSGTRARAFYVVFQGNAFYASTDAAYPGALLAAPINADGSIAWAESVDVENYEDARTLARICACVGAKYRGPVLPA